MLRYGAVRRTLCQHEVEDELLAPEDQALDDVQAEHAQRVQDVDALVEEPLLILLRLKLGLLDHLADLKCLGQTRLPCDYSSDRRLDRALLLLQVLYLFHDER